MFGKNAGKIYFFLSSKSFVPFESQGIIPLIKFESKTDLVVVFEKNEGLWDIDTPAL